VYRISRAEKLHGKISAVLIKDFFPEMEPYSRELKHFKYYDFKVEPAMILELDPGWRTFEDYLAAMSSKYRKRAKTVIKKGAAIQVRSLSAEEILENGKRIMELFDAVHLKAKFRLATLTIGYFAEMKRTFADTFRMDAYYIGEKMVGFRSTFILEDGTDAHFVGLDYGVNREHDVYQNMLYDFVKDTFATGKKKLYMGRTASEIKSTIGAEPYELYCYVRHRNPLHNRFIKPFISQVQPSEWIMRNPFKED
jgi:predicted N-acyltransferase